MPMFNRKLLAGALVLGVSVLGMLLIVGCSSADSQPSDSASPPATSTGQADPGQATPTIPPGAGLLKISTAGDNAFDKSSIQVGAGLWSIQFANNEPGLECNFHLFKGTDSSGASVAATDTSRGPDVRSLDLDLEAGSYYFRCDTHPDMHGRIDVHN
jgi:plastocyanin